MIGRDARCYAVTESTPGTYETIAGTDAFRQISGWISDRPTRERRNDASGSRSALEYITGPREITFSVEAYVVPSGSAGTPPDIHALLLSAMGGASGYANVGGTSDTYSLTATQGDQASFTLVVEQNGIHMVAAYGCVVEDMEISANGTDHPTITFSGRAMGVYETGKDTINGALSGGEDTVVVDNGEAFQVGSVIQVGTSTGHTVTAIATNSLTVSPVVSGAQGDGLDVIPYVPARTTAGSPISVTSANYDLSTDTALPLTSYSVKLENNHQFHDNVSGVETFADYHEGPRDVTGAISWRLDEDQTRLLAERASFGVKSLTATLGATAGAICTITQPQVELGYDDPDNALEGRTDNIPYMNRPASTSAELTIAFT